MESQPTGLLERLRVQRESAQSSAPSPVPPQLLDFTGPVIDVGPAPTSSESTSRSSSMIPSQGSGSPTTDYGPRIDEVVTRLARLETQNDDVRRRFDGIEANLRSGLADLRTELPGMITGEVARHVTPTNEAVADIGGRLGRMETDFTRERERWSNVVTSFDQRLDTRLRSFRQDVTVMLTGMAVLVLAMLMMLLLRR